MKIKTEDVKIFFKTVAVTSVCIGCVAGVYLGICRAYEEMRKTFFSDTRSAVIIGEEYIKFFDLEYYF